MYARTLRGIIPTFFVALLASAIFPLGVFASSDLLFSPASGSYKVDEVIPVRVLVQSGEKLSAVEASVEFDPKMLNVEISSASPSVSWVVTPTVDNEKGELRYSGMVTGDAPAELELLTLSVRGLRPGTSELRFVSGASTVAADGSGGNTLGKITHAAFDILTEEGYEGRATEDGGEVLGATDATLTISSPNIPDAATWYSLRDMTVNWTLPYGVRDVLVGLTKKAEDVGYKSVPGGTTTRELKDLDEGEWYYHITPKGKSLEDSAHFRIAIDREAPVIASTTEKERTDNRDPNLTYTILATDKISGISHFEMMVDGSFASRWEDDGSHEYKFKAPGPGEHDLTISAFDKASNRSEAHARFVVEALPQPTIKLLRDKIPEASPIVAEINGLPNASVKISFEGGPVAHDDVLSLDGNGKASYALKEAVLPGSYQLSAIQTLSNGASSKEPVRIDIEVTPSIIGYIGRNLALSIAIIPVVLFGLLYLLWRLGVAHWFAQRRLRARSMQKVAPLPLPAPTAHTRQMVRTLETAPLEIKRVVRVQQNAGSVIDLRKKN